MSNKYQELTGDISALSAAMKLAKNKDEFRRLQTVWLRLANSLNIKDISEITCYCQSWVRQLHSLYKYGGIQALLTSKKGGRKHENMSLENEEKFIQPFLLKAANGGILEVGEIHREYENKLGKSISKSVIYTLLHRHGWRKIAPRPSHPKHDKKAADAFKKTLK